jgi:hypothetical protein
VVGKVAGEGVIPGTPDAGPSALKLARSSPGTTGSPGWPV